MLARPGEKCLNLWPQLLLPQSPKLRYYAIQNPLGTSLVVTGATEEPNLHNHMVRGPCRLQALSDNRKSSSIMSRTHLVYQPAT